MLSKNSKRVTDISFLIPTHNRSCYLKECFDSVISQKVNDFEIIIIDDCSIDDTKLVVEEFRAENNHVSVTYIKNETNLGLFKSLNVGLKYAIGKYLCFLADDDKLIPGHTQRLLGILDSDKNIALSTCDGFVINTKGEMCDSLTYFERYSRENNFMLYSGKKDFKYMLEFGAISFGASILRKDCISEIGMFNPGLRIAGDMEFWLRIALSRYSVYFLKEPLFFIRNHENSLTRRNLVEFYKERIDMFEQILVRERSKLSALEIKLVNRKIAGEMFYLGITYIKKMNIMLGLKYFLESNLRSRRILIDYIVKRLKLSIASF